MRKASACSTTHERNVRAAVPVTSATVEVTRAGPAVIAAWARRMSSTAAGGQPRAVILSRASAGDWFAQSTAPANPTGWAAALADPAIGAVLNAIHRDPARGWTVQSLADEANLSRATFSRRFTSLTGQAPLTYVTWWRLTLAADLLRRSDAPLAAIADRVGYTSEFAFANAFKRQHAVAPGRYRRTGASTG
ncbi:AraC-like DNA-binding protein [Hamadaea flava]|uniref:Helix-turn-helix transcriptional regulator n=1 Tax=Hamadaea flava TaxID=1742688 RepID=A0ABV8M004_9ACTN|nr:AraC family transcriptional regulator [Hamadaea flava]MCP2328958.1 AraC-like DNA-binding protein [Hamadaea flava]